MRNGLTRRDRELCEDVVRGMWDDGASYADIRDKLGLTARNVELILGQVAALRAVGHTYAEIGRRVGLPYRTLLDIADEHQRSRLSAQETAATEALVDMYGMQTDVLAWMFRLPKPKVYQLAKRLREHRLVMPDLIPVQRGAKWVVPTGPTTSSYLGWRPRSVWRPPAKHADHYRAVAQARIMLDAVAPEAWVSERQLRHAAEMKALESRARGARTGGSLAGVHIHDGRFLGVVAGLRGWWAVEVELTAKSAKHMDRALRGAMQAALDAQPDPMDGLLYLYRGKDVERGIVAARKRLPPHLADDSSLAFAMGDFDEEWRRYLDTTGALRRATSPRLSTNPIPLIP